MKTHLKVLLFSALMTLSGNFYAQVCQASWFVQSGAVTGEKLFVDNSYNVSSITLLTPGATPTSSIFLPGDTASVIFSSSGIHPVTYIVSNASTGCSDTINTSVEVCLIDPPVISFSANPGEFTVTDPSLDDPSETGAIYFNGINSTNYTVTGNQYLNYSSNSTVMVTNSNGPHAFWYHTDNGAGNCYDSILVSFEMNSVVNCQANLSASSMTWLSPGTFYLLDQSLNNSVGVFNCPGATPSTVVFEPWNGVISDTIEFPANGTYPYTYVTYDSISNCTDSISGVVSVTAYPPPCYLQAGSTVSHLNPNPQYYSFQDNSTNITGAWTGSLSFTPNPGIGSYPSTITNTGSYAMVFNSNGVYHYTYTVTDSVCSSTITDSIVVYSYPSGSPCQANIQWTMGPGPGQVTLTDTSSNYTSGTFFCANAIPQTSTVVPGGNTIIEFSSNSVFSYSYTTENSNTACTDSILGLITVSGVPCPPMNPVQWTTTSTPGEIIFEDPTFNGVGYAHVNFLSASNTVIYPGYPITQGNTTTATVGANGTYIYSYRIFNNQINCVDSIIDTLVINSFTGCQAGLTYTSNAPGSVYVFDQSSNVQQGTLYCAGASPQSTTISINPLPSSSYSGLLTFAANGSYSYTYIVENTTTGCTDTLTGTFVVNGLPTPCNVQASVSVAAGAGLGDYVITDNSTGGASISYFSPGNGQSAIQLLPNTSITVNYPGNGTYWYEYLVIDTTGICTDTLFAPITVTGYPLPCTTQAGLIITQGTNVGEFTITDNSANAATGAFYSTNSGGTVALSPGGTSAIDYASNGWHYYTYIVEDSTGGCQDTITGSVYVSGVNCGAFAGLIMTPTGTPGEYVLTDNSTAGSTSYFNPGNGPGVQVLPSPSVTYNYTTNGTFNYTYYVNDSTTLCTDSVQGTVVVSGVIPPANCSASFTLMQDSLNMSQYYCWNNAVNSTGGTSGLSYLWDFGDGATSTQAYPTHTYSTLGTFTLCLTITEAINGCTSTFCDTIVVTVKASGTTINVLPSGASIGIDEGVLVSNLSLFPNPSDGIFKLQLESKVHTTIEVQIVSSTGQVVYTSIETIDEGPNEFNMDQSHISEGLYLVKLKDVRSGVFETIRFVKK